MFYVKHEYQIQIRRIVLWYTASKTITKLIYCRSPNEALQLSDHPPSRRGEYLACFAVF